MIRLEFFARDATEKAERPCWEAQTAGTGFFVWDGRDTYLVSARHVVDRDAVLRARVPTQRDDGTIEVVELTVRSEGWVFHPRSEERSEGGKRVAPVDVAVARVPRLRDRRVKTIGYCPEPCDRNVLHQFAKDDPEPPVIVLMFGFPLDLGFELAEQRPMARMGIVSMVAGETFVQEQGVFLDARTRLLDMPVYPGNSGSPVFSHPQPAGRFELLGVVTAANDAYRYAVSEPVSRIAETLEAARSADRASAAAWFRLDQETLPCEGKR